MTLSNFHPAVSAWFEADFEAPTEVQTQAWPAIREQRHTLIAAPTGSGKTLAAFLAAIDALVKEGLERGLSHETHVLYVSPLKALSNDIQKNLQQPLNGIRDKLLEQGLPDVPVSALVRTGDTPAGERERMRREPPHILVTTPESLYILLTSESGRNMLSTVRSVIVDEIHALAGNKRGSHLSLSLERLAALCPLPPVRIGLSATQKPIEEMARFLTGADEGCTIIDTGHVRRRDLAIEVTGSPLEALMANEVWAEIYDRLAELIEAHRTTLIFVNTRRLAERAARFLSERLSEEQVTAHHGSLSREHRLDAEQRLKSGQLKALIATASLELGIDIGDVDLVCQLGSPRSIAGFLQRVGRSGHAVHAIPKGRLFPLSRDDLIESAALLDAIRHDELDRIRIPDQPLDVLTQQIVAEVASREWNEDELYRRLCHAWPYRNLTQESFSELVRMLADGFSTRRGRRSAWLHRDAVHGQLRPRRSARLTALLNGGAIPDQFDYQVILSPEGHLVGTLNEDFAFESLPGDIFQLGNTSYRMLKIEQGKVHVEDAKGQPPNIPFWFGEAPGRSDELSWAVSRLLERIEQQLDSGLEATTDWLISEYRLPRGAAFQLTQYLGAAKAALGVLPNQSRIIFERFFDEAGDMHFVIHSPFGSRLNRAWGLALRKRFCRRFNFELQAAATEDNVVLSLGPTHSFPLEEVKGYLKAKTVREILIQALLAAPMFATHWRWNATIALAVIRNRNGKRTPAQFQRSDAEDLVAVVFPDQLACFENIAGDREIPDHPLVRQTISDCLHEVMDIDGLEQLLKRLEANQIEVVARDLATPSPLAQEILNARPYAFLDDAPAEERRTLAVQQRRYLDPASAADIGRLDPAAIERVCNEAWPEPRTADELHDALYVLGFITLIEGEKGTRSTDNPIDSLTFDWRHLFTTLMDQQRATELTTPNGGRLWVARERLGELLALFPNAPLTPPLSLLDEPATLAKEDALKEIIRSRLEGLGPVTAQTLATPLSLPTSEIDFALLALEQEGFAIRGQFTGNHASETEWCERGLLARIHRYTLKQLRSEIEPVAPADFMRFLFHWHRLDEQERGEGEEALAAAIAQLEGFAVPAAAWEAHILPARVRRFDPQMLDNLCASGRLTWLRANLPASRDSEGKRRHKAAPVRVTPILLLERAHLHNWLDANARDDGIQLSSGAGKVMQYLQDYGASFLTDLIHGTGMLRTQVESALGELVATGQVTADSFAGLRALISPNSKKRRHSPSRRRHAWASVDVAGRWVLVRRPRPEHIQQSSLTQDDKQRVEAIAQILLRRYGVVFRKVLERESNLPAWRELLYVYRRMEARGEIRGGRFVQGFSGEQYALPDALTSLRRIRSNQDDETLIAISGADPLNLTSIITPGKRAPANAGNRVLYRNGSPVAMYIGRQVEFLGEIDPKREWELRQTLLRQQQPAAFHNPLTSLPS
ncbi:MAG: DEAD/DEAH box helicase [Pseudomonadota bacterium]